MNNINIKLITFLLTMLCLTNAQAGFDITRMTTIVDDYNGSYTVTKSGRLENREFSGNSITEFTNFHFVPENEIVNITGTLSKTVTRTEGNKTTQSDGQLILTTSEKTVNINFADLVVQITQDGVLISGDVTANDETFDANELPTKLSKLLKRVFFMTRK